MKIIYVEGSIDALMLKAALEAQSNDDDLRIEMPQGTIIVGTRGDNVGTWFPENLENINLVEFKEPEFEELNTLLVEPSTETKGKHKYPFYHKSKW